jgi:DNA mismatch repair protein MutL
MPRIQALTQSVVAKITAGEVIERPAGVLKELMENSIDAGASRIDVEIAQGGLESLRICDNGCGIHPDDLPLALTNHATSKLSNADELFSIGTLGFRGEGLASVAAVSKLTLQSRTAENEVGAEVFCDGGDLVETRVWNGAVGTRIEVRHLFFNTPVRRKFLKGAATEMSHLSEVFLRLALSNLSVHFTLRHNNKLLYDLPSSFGLLDRISAFFGEDLRKQLRMVEAEQGSFTLGGYVADPICERGGTQMQYWFINGRWIRDRGLSQALQEAYRGLLLTGKHPVAFLFLEMPADFVDVNVHPTKAEVRFRQPEKLQAFVCDSVRGMLQGEDLTAPLHVRAPVSQPAATQNELTFAPRSSPIREEEPAEESPNVSIPPPSRPATKPAPTQPSIAFAKPTVNDEESPPTIETKNSARQPAQPRPQEARPSVPKVSSDPEPASEPSSSSASKRGLASVRAVQMHDLYLVVEVPEGILIIDQHALHERILFEQLKTRFAQQQLTVQKLLIPETVTLSPSRADLLLRQRQALAELGLEIDDFGGGTVVINGYPAVLGKQCPRDVLLGIIEYCENRDRLPSRAELLNDLMALMACHSAVRAGDRLPPELLADLVEQRHLAQDSHHCPHGRPSSLLLTRHDLDKQFRRLG